MIPAQLPNDWIEKVVPATPVATLGLIQLTEREKLANFWRFKLQWAEVNAELYQFVQDVEVPHQSPSVVCAIGALTEDQLSPRLEGWADPTKAAFISMNSGHNLTECLLQVIYDDASDFNMHEAEPDVAIPLRQLLESYKSGELVTQWKEFARKTGRTQLVYETENPRMYRDGALANGFVPEETANGRTYWRLDI